MNGVGSREMSHQRPLFLLTLHVYIFFCSMTHTHAQVFHAHVMESYFYFQS